MSASHDRGRKRPKVFRYICQKESEMYPSVDAAIIGRSKTSKQTGKACQTDHNFVFQLSLKVKGKEVL